MNYVVGKDDTLERIAASHDCTVGELVKLNRMASRMVGFFLEGIWGCIRFCYFAGSRQFIFAVSSATLVRDSQILFFYKFLDS
jgi:hypothetical protein